ncbi:HepT-like ribonuclease domain-containing protein [Rothia nasimurium]|uniref:HepT-like ribonuclease domain-containing protein n=1 Tax=Rothia nasimurium TaxID=85336 RepID=UPI001F3DB4A0|nr:HepT-like ribonuclease domain-containing protein [Rothia nasimurium]
MSRSPLSRLEDITAVISACLEYSAHLIDPKFSGMALDAIERNLGIIGEAVNHLPKEVTAQYPEIDWVAIVGLRNFLIHEYFAVDEEVVYEILEKYLIPLQTTVNLATSRLDNS